MNECNVELWFLLFSSVSLAIESILFCYKASDLTLSFLRSLYAIYFSVLFLLLLLRSAAAAAYFFLVAIANVLLNALVRQQEILAREVISFLLLILFNKN